MNYENILDLLLNKIPEIRDFYEEKKQENLVDDDSGKHIIFGIVIVPYILAEVNNHGKNVKQIFDFLEEMSLCEDVKVGELLDFTILEQFVDEGEKQLSILKSLMHENVLKCCIEVEKYFIVE